MDLGLAAAQGPHPALYPCFHRPRVGLLCGCGMAVLGPYLPKYVQFRPEIVHIYVKYDPKTGHVLAHVILYSK